MAPRRNRYWIWFFVLVGLLTLGAIITLISYNMAQQLKVENVETARQRWDQQGPSSYDLLYKINRQDQNGVVEEHFAIKVRHGHTVYGTFRTSSQVKETPLKTRLYPTHNVSAFFDFLDDYLKQSAKSGTPRAFMRALFDPGDGHLLHFVRSVSGTNSRLEITVTEVKPASTPPLTRQELTTAQQRWEKSGPRDYRLEYLLGEGDGSPGDRLKVLVRDGELAWAKRDDQVLASKEPGVYDMERLFAKMQTWQREDEAAQRTATEAIFDPHNGQIRWYRRTSQPPVEFLVDPVEPQAGGVP